MYTPYQLVAVTLQSVVYQMLLALKEEKECEEYEEDTANLSVVYLHIQY